MKGEGWEPGDPIPVFLPEWAEGLAEGDYTKPMASLPTKDGRCTGNATMIRSEMRHGFLCYLVITDAGNIIWCVESELKELFHPPTYTMKELLPTPAKALACE